MVKWVEIGNETYMDMSAMVVMRFTYDHPGSNHVAFWAVCGNDLIEVSRLFQAKDEAVVQKLRNIVKSAPDWVQIYPQAQPDDDFHRYGEHYANLNNIGVVVFSKRNDEQFERAILVTPVGPIVGTTDRADTTQKVRDWLKGAV